MIAAQMHTSEQNSTKRTYRLSTTAIAEYIPSFFSLLRQPRRFLAQRATGGAPELVRAFVFFILTVLVGLAMLLSVYTPKDSVIGFSLVALTLHLVATIASSALLWAAVRIVGVTGHYTKLLVILLHQAAVLQLAVLVSMWIIVGALDLRSFDVVRQSLHEALQPGSSIDVGTGDRRAYARADSGDARGAACNLRRWLVLLVALAWAIWSCGAYRQALELSRTRSMAALLIVAAFTWAVFRLVDLAA